MCVCIGFPDGSDGKKSACKAQVQVLDKEDPLEKGMATQASILSWKFHGQRKLANYSPWGDKESDMIEWLACMHTNVCVCVCVCEKREDELFDGVMLHL